MIIVLMLFGLESDLFEQNHQLQLELLPPQQRLL